MTLRDELHLDSRQPPARLSGLLLDADNGADCDVCVVCCRSCPY